VADGPVDSPASGGDWPREHIPDPDRVFFRVHDSFIPRGVLNVGVFQDHEGGMSVDWEKYSTPAQLQTRAKTPAKNAIVSFRAGEVRQIQTLRVEHEPLRDNRAHSEIFGEKDPEVRVKLSRLMTWEIRLKAS